MGWRVLCEGVDFSTPQKLSRRACSSLGDSQTLCSELILSVRAHTSSIVAYRMETESGHLITQVYQLEGAPPIFNSDSLGIQRPKGGGGSNIRIHEDQLEEFILWESQHGL